MNKAVYSLALFLFMMAAIRVEQVQAADDWIIHMFTQFRTQFFSSAFLFLTDFGAAKLLLPILTIVILLMALLKNIVPSLLLFLLYVTERGTNDLLKLIVQRQRPNENPLAAEPTFSFPSGHSMNSASLYLFLAYLFITYVPFFYQRKIITWIIAVTFVFLIGISRVYLGVHFLTDVVAGWSLGYFCFLLFKKFDERLLAFRQN